MPIIRQLSELVVNKIAAGEVIERPASVVKELMENSLDAGATRVDVTLSEGGGELIRVVDNGLGIEPEQLPLALASHATSKITSDEDLFSVASLGFRGEAIASIASVSHLVIRSRTAADAAGAQIESHGGRVEPIQPCGCPVGTTVEVQNLFFNTPVRRKFLRKAPTEMGHCTEAVYRLALAHPAVHFTLRNNQRQIADLPPCDDVRTRIAELYSEDIADHLLWVESENGPVRLSGYVANPSHSRGNNKLQFLFLNGRFIRDRALSHALAEAYRGLLMTGRQPISFLRLDMPAEQVDVNVHPTKLEVRFQDAGSLYSQLLGTLRTRFLSTDLTARFDSVGDESSAAAHDAASADAQRRELVQWAKAELGEPSDSSAAVADPTAANPAFAPQGDTEFSEQSRLPLQLNPLPQDWLSPPQPTDSSAAVPTSAPAMTAAIVKSVDGAAALQIKNRYLVAESEDGILVIDQHALHERVLYEQLREKVLAGEVEIQTLLVPEPVDLAPAEAAAVIEASDSLAELGVLVEDFGGGTVLVSGYPAMLARLTPAEVVRMLAEKLVQGDTPPDRRDMLDEMLHSFACQAAIKAGDRLTPEEVSELLLQRHLAQDAHHCPHGRPTSLVLTQAHLDKQFKRT